MSAFEDQFARYMSEGQALMEMRRDADAATAFRRAVTLDPQNAEAYVRLSSAEIRLER